MALTDSQKITLSRTLGEAASLLETGLMRPGGLTVDQAAAQITADLATIDSLSTDTPKGADLRADLLRVAALQDLLQVKTSAYNLTAQTWATLAAALL